jgi:hypothetical protein
MSPIKAELLQTLETAPEETIEETLIFLKQRLQADPSLRPGSGRSIRHHAGKWQSDNLEECRQSVTETSEAKLLQRINLGFSADWWQKYRALIADRQAETINESDLAQLIEMSEAIELANVGRIEALGELAKLRGCEIETVMAEVGIGSGING